ncbi:MAG: O-antigen ligase family protein [Bacteroidetes bacterium]|nr:O-antigen ligase family protein [Bacteroidota bacterium]
MNALGLNRLKWSHTHEYLLTLCAFFMPLQLRVLTFVLVALFVCVIVMRVLKVSSSAAQELRLAVFFPFAFFSAFLVWGWFEQPQHIEVLKEIETKAPFFFLPVLFIFLPKLSFQSRSQIFRAFTAGTLVFVVLSIIHALVRLIFGDGADVFFYQKLSWTFHPSYLALYCCLAIGSIYYDLSTTNRGCLYNNLLLIMVFLLACYIAFLSSKSGFLSLFLTFFILLYYTWRRQLKMKNFWLFTLLIGLGFGIPFFTVGQINGRVAAAFTDVNSQQVTEKKASTAMRFVTWQASLNIVKQNPLGVGTGNWKMALRKEYSSMNELEAARKPLPSHNAFLQIAVEWGYIGLFLLVGLVILNLYYAFKSKGLFFWLFGVLMPFNFLFESMLELQQGIVLFTFFTLLLGFRKYSQGFPSEMA